MMIPSSRLPLNHSLNRNFSANSDKGSSMIHQRIEKKDFVPNNNQKSELTPTERILKPVKFIAVEANLFSSSGDGKAPQNVVKGMLSSSPSKKRQEPSNIRKNVNKTAKQIWKPGRTSELKRDVVLSNNIRGNVGYSLSEGPTKPELIPTSIQLSKINLALEASSKQNNLNGGELVRKTKDEIMEESMVKVRNILTELLFETTENQILIIAKEELKRAKSIAQSVQKKFSVLSALSGKIGLNIFDSESDTSDKEDKPYERNQLESDEELETLIKQRLRNFEKIEMHIDLEIESREENEKSIAYQNDTGNVSIVKSECGKSNVDADKVLKSSLHGSNNINSNSANEIVPTYHNPTNDSNNNREKQQTHCHQIKHILPLIKADGTVENFESTQEILSSSTSTLSPSSLSSTTSCSSPSYSSSSSSGSDSDSRKGGRTKRETKISRTNSKSSPSKGKRYTRYNRPRSKECRRTLRSPSRSRHSGPYRRRVSLSPLRSHRVSSWKRRERRSSEQKRRKHSRNRSNSREFRRSRCFERSRR